LGAEYKGKKIGCFSDMTVFSFHPVKHITTGEGGMILTDNEGFYQKLKIFRHHGVVKDDPSKGAWHYDIYSPGYNFRITDFQCALGISQMKKLDRFFSKRREIAAKYDQALASIPEIIIPKVSSEVKHAYHIYVIQLRLNKIKVGRKEIFDALKAENIGVNVHYMPLHLHPFYQKQFGYQVGDFPVAEQYYERAITLPIFPAMSDKDVDDVIQATKQVVDYFKKQEKK
jgi:dTDP-4-amino-4,6-dideoxygalactose transaminase